MNRTRITARLIALVLAAGVVACGSQPAPAPAPPSPTVGKDQLSVFERLPSSAPAASGPASPEMIALGRMLYFEPRLSKSQTISCNTCHDLANYGVDGEPTSDGHKGQKGDRNSPTVYNAAAHFAQFWDGRAADVEEQAKGPILNPVEMAMPGEAKVIAVLNSMPEYVDRFQSAFPNDKQPIGYDNMAKAIGAFERNLMTPSRWDALLDGDASALTPEEMVGLKTFLDTGCQACHSGALLGGTSFERLGRAKEYPDLTDPGRAKITKSDTDKGSFKVPSLRNIEKTGPYYHDGKMASLDEAIRAMAEYQLGEELTDQQVAEILTFLKVLTGKIDPEYIKPPVLPKSTSKTPKPDLS